MDNKATLTLDQPASYRLCLNGRISADWSDWLINTVVTFDNDQTFISGVVRDQAALFGLLSFVRDLGVPLVSVELLPGDKNKTMKMNITRIALKGIAMAMGVAVFVLSTLRKLDVSAGVSMLGVGLTILALANFQE